MQPRNLKKKKKKKKSCKMMFFSFSHLLQDCDVKVHKKKAAHGKMMFSHLLQDCDVKVHTLLTFVSFFFFYNLQRVTYMTQNFLNSRIYLVTVLFFLHKNCSIIKSIHKD